MLCLECDIFHNCSYIILNANSTKYNICNVLVNERNLHIFIYSERYTAYSDVCNAVFIINIFTHILYFIYRTILNGINH